MPSHLLVYSASIAQNSLLDVAAVADPVFAVQNGHYLPQEDLMLQWAMAFSATISRARIVSPSARQVTTPWIRPTATGVAPPTNPGVWFMPDDPFKIMGLEELEVDILQGGAGAEQVTALLSVRSSFEAVPGGPEFVMRGTGTTTVVANAWTQTAITWQDILPTGWYVVTGFEAQGATAKAARLIFEQQTYRPGVPGITAVGNRMNDDFYTNKLGVFGKFRSTRLPLVEYFCNAADTAQEVYMSFKRISNVA